ETNREAELLSDGLEQLGISCSIVSDQQLEPGRLPTRIRGLRFDVDKILLTDFNTDEVLAIEPEDLAVIVTGILFQYKTESTKKLKRGGKGKIFDETPTFTDEVLMDI